jgi:hypothetical protein
VPENGRVGDIPLISTYWQQAVGSDPGVSYLELFPELRGVTGRLDPFEVNKYLWRKCGESMNNVRHSTHEVRQ